MVDTGFNGDLALPLALMRGLGLQVGGGHRHGPANGRTELMDVYPGKVDWDGSVRSVMFLCLDNVPLIGTGLLHGSRVTIGLIENGAVTVEALPAG